MYVEFIYKDSIFKYLINICKIVFLYCFCKENNDY